MEHVTIWIQTLAVIVGTGVLFDTFQIHKTYRYPFLKPMWWFFLFLNLSLLMGVFSRYLHINFFEDIMVYKASFFVEIIDPMTSLFYAALVYSLLLVNRTFHGKDLPMSVHRLFIGVFSFIVFRTLMGLIIRRSTICLSIINLLNICIMICAFTLSVALLGDFIITSRRSEDRNKAKTWTIFGAFYLCGYTLILLSSLFAGSRHGPISAFLSLMFNIFPFVWYRNYLIKHDNALPYVVAETDLQTVYEKYGVSSRQREIVELLLHGKSNRDIAAALFIAPHTVKNHIYMLYQKLGVKSRFELINFFLENAKKQTGI